MRRHIRLTALRFTVLLFTLMASSCELDSGEEPRPEVLGHMLWEVSLGDIRRVNSVLGELTKYHYMLQIEDDTERQAYADRHFGNAAIIVIDNRHTLQYTTYFGTTYSLIIDMYADRWEVQRTGGNSYKATIARSNDGRFDVTFHRLNNEESSGYATLSGQLSIDNEGQYELLYTGEMVMIDREESATSPLTFTTDISYPIRYSSTLGLLDGSMTITAYDALYRTTDTAKATIVPYEHRVVIETESRTGSMVVSYPIE